MKGDTTQHTVKPFAVRATFLLLLLDQNTIAWYSMYVT